MTVQVKVSVILLQFISSNIYLSIRKLLKDIPPEPSDPPISPHSPSEVSNRLHIVLYSCEYIPPTLSL